MNTTTARQVDGTARSRHEITAGFGRWTLRVLLAAQFAAGGVMKLAGDPVMVSMFDDIGVGQWFRIAVGVCEAAGAIGLLLNRWTRSAATALVLLMIGAAMTNIVALGISPVPPLVYGALAVVVVVLRGREEGSR